MSYKRSNFPEQYDKFIEKADISPDKMPLVGEYHELFNKTGRTEGEDARLDFLAGELQANLITPEHINHFQDAMTNVQKFFKENTKDYVDALQLETTEHADGVKADTLADSLAKKTETKEYMDTVKTDATTHADEKKVEVELKIDRFKHQGTYNPEVQYFERNVVDFNDGAGAGVQSYIATKNAIGVDPTTQTHWTKLTIQGVRGQKGLDGIGLKFRGRYDKAKTYAKDDGVQFGGAMFGSLVDGNIDNTPSLSTDTAYWAKALDVAITVSTGVGVRTIATDTDTVNFITGEITTFNKDVDTLEVYQNSVRLTRGVDYDIGLDSQTIVKKDDVWEGSTEPIFFEFVVIRNQVNDLVFSDGQSIADGTITKNKLSSDVQGSLNEMPAMQTELDKMPILTETIGLNASNIAINSGNIGDKQQLATKNKGSMVNAINEVSARIDDLSFSSNAINFAGTSLNEGAQIKLNWTNKTDSTLENNELFVSTGDISNATVEHCRINGTLIYEGVNETYTHNTSKNILYYFKLFTTYSIGGVRHVSTGATTQVLSEDLTPPAKATGIELTTGDAKASIIYAPPANTDYMGTRLVYNTTSTPENITDGAFIANYISDTEITGLANDVMHYFRLFPYDTSNNFNTESGQSVGGMPKAYQLYGVQIDTNNSNPETAVAYTDMAVGFTPMFCNNGTWQMGSWGDKFPFNEIKPCLLKNGVVNYYLDPNDYTKKAAGGASDITSGTDGDVMIEFPKIYWKFERIGTDLHVRYSDVQIDEGYKCLAHSVGDVGKDKIYISAYKGHSMGGKLRSLSGKAPHTNATIGAFRSAAQANGAGYQQFTYYPMLMLQVLALVAGKNRDSQTQLGRGYVDGNSAAISTGNTNKKGMYYGENTGKQQLKFCGIEDFYGNVRDWVDGMYSDGSRNMMISDQTVFNDNGSGYKNHGVGASSNLSGYIGDVQGGTETGFIIKSSSGSATTHYSDYGYLYAGYLPYFGARWKDGDSGGAFLLDVSDSASGANATVGGRVCVL